MLEDWLQLPYRRLGRWYPTAFVAVALQASWPITAGAVGFLALYVKADASALAGFLALALVVTFVSIVMAILRSYRILEPVMRWLDGERGVEASLAAWRTAVALPLSFWRGGWYLLPLVGVPLAMAAGGALILGASLAEAAFIYGTSIITVLYSAILFYFVAEAGMRPLVADVARCLPAGVRFDNAAIPLRWKLLGALPAINVITGFLAVGLSSSERDVSALGLDALAAIVGAFAVSMTLTLLLARSLRRPLIEMIDASDRVREGDFGLRVPLTTSDEVGQLTSAFNQMVGGLKERERIRSTLGTYLDPAVAERLVDGGGPVHGEEIEVSALMLDVRGFTAFAVSRPPSGVVAALNRLYEVVVPIVAEQGGHVDKFIGDGLLAIFGAPRKQRDHADRAIEAAVEIDRRVRGDGADHLRVGIGISSGPVLVGNIGGGGRLDFSVIGDAVNLAARAQDATRIDDDPILFTEATRDLLAETEIRVERSRSLRFDGQREPVVLYAPRTAVPSAPGARA